MERERRECDYVRINILNPRDDGNHLLPRYDNDPIGSIWCSAGKNGPGEHVYANACGLTVQDFVSITGENFTF